MLWDLMTREMLYFLTNFTKKYDLHSTGKLVDYINGYEKSLYREVFDRNIRQCNIDQQRLDLPVLERLISEMP